MFEIEELDPRIRMRKTDHETHLTAQLISSTSHCPDCGARCCRRHGFTWRRIGNLFRIQHYIRLTLRVPKWFCDNPNFERIIFTERIEWAMLYSRRTNRTTHVLTILMLGMNAKEEVRVCPTVGIRNSQISSGSTTSPSKKTSLWNDHLQYTDPSSNRIIPFTESRRADCMDG